MVVAENQANRNRDGDMKTTGKYVGLDVHPVCLPLAAPQVIRDAAVIGAWFIHALERDIR